MKDIDLPEQAVARVEGKPFEQVSVVEGENVARARFVAQDGAILEKVVNDSGVSWQERDSSTERLVRERESSGVTIE